MDRAHARIMYHQGGKVKSTQKKPSVNDCMLKELMGSQRGLDNGYRQESGFGNVRLKRFARYCFFEIQEGHQIIINRFHHYSNSNGLASFTIQKVMI